MNKRISKLAFIFLSVSLIFSSTANAGTKIYFSPNKNIEKTDIRWLGKAIKEKRLYIAMYAFTDYRLARELIFLANNGVKIYLYRDDRQMKDRADKTRMLKNIPNISVKAKRDSGPWNIMHEKIFIIPGVVLREGSANWSPSGEGASCYRYRCGHGENQDNTVVYITGKKAITSALRNFLNMWGRGNNLVIY